MAEQVRKERVATNGGEGRGREVEGGTRGGARVVITRSN